MFHYLKVNKNYTFPGNFEDNFSSNYAQHRRPDCRDRRAQ